jgi:hypothetical protein
MLFDDQGSVFGRNLYRMSVALHDGICSTVRKGGQLQGVITRLPRLGGRSGGSLDLRKMHLSIESCFPVGRYVEVYRLQQHAAIGSPDKIQEMWIQTKITE